MEKYDVLIIGSGLGGLLCGNILSREGYKVCVVEKNKKIGGCLQSFAKDKCIFSTGLNYTEGLSEGQILYKYFKYFGIYDKLKLKQMDIDGFEVITFKGKEYRHAQGEENFIETLVKEFPDEREAITKYLYRIKELCNSFPLYNLDIEDDSEIDYNELFSESAFDYIKSITQNESLQNVLAGNNLLYAGVADKTPLYIHALITFSFISSSWRLIDGSQQLATIIAKTITQNGGHIFRNSEVTKLVTSEGKIHYAALSDGRTISANTYISNLHPINTINMLDESCFSKAYRNRIKSLENTIGVFSLYIVLHENTFEYQNYNHYYFDGDTVWTTGTYSQENWPDSYLFYTPPHSSSEEYARCIIAMTYMDYSEVREWEGTAIENRGADYQAFKKEKAERFLDVIEKKFPGLRSKIKKYYSSTPLSYRDYTGTHEGTSYGILKNYNEPFKTLIMPKTKIPNLLFTGQNLNIHGILGVSIGAVMTCGELLGLPYILKQIKSSG